MIGSDYVRTTAAERASRDGIVPLRIGQGRWVCASSSQQGVGYQLAMDDQGHLSCSCPGGSFADCKHRAAVRGSLEGERAELPPVAGGSDHQAAGWGAQVVDHASVAAAIPAEHWIERQGRKFVLYAGLLDAAHRAGLTYLASELVQAGTDANGLTWICASTARFADGREFHELADASPSNVSRSMLVNMPRLAATRAKARALRDAVNVGVAAVEELGGDDASWTAPAIVTPHGSPPAAVAPLDDDGRVRVPSAPAKVAEPPTFEEAFPGQEPTAPLFPRPAELDHPRGAIERLAPAAGVTPPQARNILRLLRGLGEDAAAAERSCVDRFSCKIDGLTRRDASAWITELDHVSMDIRRDSMNRD